MGPGNESCKDVLLHSDRLMLIDQLYNSMTDIWVQSKCDSKSLISADIKLLCDWISIFVLF